MLNRYAGLVIVLHWLMAAGILMMLASGVVMEYFDIEKSLKFNLIQWHKSGGVLLLLAFVARISLRIIEELRHKIPPLPKSFAALEKWAAKAGHGALYALMFLMPLSGWLMVSSSVYGLPTIVFGWFEWPHIPGVAGDKAINGFARETHFILAIIFAVVISLHIAAVVKHAALDKENLLTRMWWSK